MTPGVPRPVYLDEPVQMTDRYWTTVADQAALLRWAAPRCGIERGWIPDTECMGVTDGRNGPVRLVGLLNCYHDEGAWCHIASSGAAPRPLLTCLGPFFHYAFRVRKLRRITARIPVRNVAAQMLALRLGFTVEGRERAGFKGQDLAILAMLAEDAAWLDDEEASE